MSNAASNQETRTATNAKPLLIYDGDCGFCKYWVNYWQKLTRNAVNYQPYQDAASQYPEIPIASFQRAVQYVAPDGKIASGAEASFLTLNNAPGNHFWLTLYRRLPGFAFLSEKAYALIAAHRDFFYVICLLLWGRDYEPPRYIATRWLFLRGLGLIALIAFISFGLQAQGLIGSQGIIPVNDLMTAAQQQLGSDSYHLLPMLFWLNGSDLMIQTVCIGGMVASLALVFNILPRISLLLIYLLYLSLCTAGQLFMTFQWDMLLLETAVIAIFLLPFPTLGIWLLRFLLFRFMFVSGMVKIMSGEPAWWDLSVLHYYFLTEPLPTPLAWYAAKLPEWLLKAGTLTTLFIELVLPFLIFMPRHIRYIAAAGTLFLQIIILITGNYNFFNLTVILLCLVLFDDAALRRVLPARWWQALSQRNNQRPPYKITAYIAGIFVVFTVFLSGLQYHLRFGGSAPIPMLMVQAAADPFRIVNTYGPFSVITKDRMEIIVEGTTDGVTWKEYAFKYKPGDVQRRPLWNIPLQPRVDWQLWFAALGTAKDNPWFTRFMIRLLENSPPVVALLENNPFPDKPPVSVRAEFYDYHFTTVAEREKTGAWWTRDLMGIYFPAAQLEK